MQSICICSRIFQIAVRGGGEGGKFPHQWGVGSDILLVGKFLPGEGT